MNKFQVLKGLTVMLGGLVLLTSCNIEGDKGEKKDTGVNRQETKGTETERPSTDRR